MQTPLSDSLLFLIGQFLDDGARTRDFARTTLRTWGPNLRAFVRWCAGETTGIPSVADFTLSNLKHYLTYLQTRPTQSGRAGLRPRTIHSHFSALRAFGRYLVDTKRRRTNPAADIPLPEFDEPEQKFLHEEEVRALLSACERLYPARRRLLATALVSVLFCTGLRRSEVADLRLADVHLGLTQDECYLVAEHAKGDKRHTAYLPPETVEALSAWLAEREKMGCKKTNQWLFAITRTRRFGDAWWRELREELKQIAGLTACDRFHPHACRRALATHLDDQGAPITQIQAALGHSRIETTVIYLEKSKRRRAKFAHLQGWKQAQAHASATEIAPGSAPTPPAAPPTPAEPPTPQHDTPPRKNATWRRQIERRNK